MSSAQTNPSTDTYHLFKSQQTSWTYYCRKGQPCVFVQGQYFTKDPVIIQELKEEVANGHPAIYIDENQVTFNPETDTPMAKLRSQMREQIIAELMESQKNASGDPARDMGTSKQDQLNPASTSTIAPVAAGGNGMSTAAQAMLTSLKKP